MSNKKRLFLFIILGLIIVAIAAIFYARYQLKKNVQENKETTQTEKATTAEEETTETATNTTTQNEDEAEKWNEYKNYLYKFLISYPKDAKIEDASSEKADNINNAKCVKIYTDNYYVMIGSTTDDLEDPAFCFRTGVGADWTNGPTDTVTAAGQEYNPNGMHTESVSAGYYEDFFSIATVDQRVQIEYGTSVNEKYGTMTKAQAKEIVHKIIASYSPAE